MKYLVLLSLVAFIVETSAVFGPNFGLSMDYPQMAMAPQLGPRFRFEKEEEPVRHGRRRFYKEETLPICPLNLESDECFSECDRDNDCAELQICCKSGCSTACVDQDLSDVSDKKNQIEEEKEEEEEIQITLECPKVNVSSNCSEINEKCTSDSDCDIDSKCCRVRCSMRCVGPRSKSSRPRGEIRRKKYRGNDRQRKSRIESLYKNDNILLSNSRHIYPNFLSQQGQYFPRFSMNFGN